MERFQLQLWRKWKEVALRLPRSSFKGGMSFGILHYWLSIDRSLYLCQCQKKIGSAIEMWEWAKIPRRCEESVWPGPHKKDWGGAQYWLLFTQISISCKYCRGNEEQNTINQEGLHLIFFMCKHRYQKVIRTTTTLKVFGQEWSLEQRFSHWGCDDTI